MQIPIVIAVWPLTIDLVTDEKRAGIHGAVIRVSTYSGPSEDQKIVIGGRCAKIGCRELGARDAGYCFGILG
jgi:hypothetical protein